MAEFMRNTDAFALGMEDDARLRSTVVTIVMLDRSPDWDVLVDRLERVARLMPMFRQRVVATMPPAPPRWVYDPDFDLRYHLRRVIAPHPGTLETVLEMARRAEMSEFDHARPMWTATLVEGLERRRRRARRDDAPLPRRRHRRHADRLPRLRLPARARRPRPAAARTRGACARPLRRRTPCRGVRRRRWYAGWLGPPPSAARSWSSTACEPRAPRCGRSGRPRPRSTAPCGRSTRPRRRSCRTGA